MRAGTSLGEYISESHKGTLVDYLECQTCNTHKERTEPFLDLSLDVEGTKTVEAALSAYLQPEILHGANAYKCPVCKSKQPAKKGTSWLI